MATERPDTDELACLADAVVDETSFLQFLSALAKDFRDHREASPQTTVPPGAQVRSAGRTRPSTKSWTQP